MSTASNPRSQVAGERSFEFDPLSPEQLADPYPVYSRVRSEHPVLYSDRFDLWIVTRYEDVLSVVRDHETFSSRDAVRSSVEPPPPAVARELERGFPEAPTLTDSDEPYHRRLRDLVSEAFTHKRVAEMEPQIRRRSSALLDELAPAGEGDLIESFAAPLPLTVVGDLLGVPDADLPELHTRAYNWLRLLQATDPVEDMVRYARAFVALQHYFYDALLERRDRPRDDLMTALLEARTEAEDPLTIEEAMRVPQNLIVAGHVTVTRAIGNAIVFLLEHPGHLAELAGTSDSKLISSAVEELLRLESPAQGLFRVATRDAEVGGVAIPKGARLMVHYGAANRDESMFESPDSYDPYRAGLMRHMAFGKGIHVCIGAPLARLELQVALPMLLERLPGLRLDPSRPPERDTIFFARGFRHLWLQWG